MHAAAQSSGRSLSEMDFDDLWSLSAPLVQPANTCRGGESRISRIVLAGREVYLKRQSNHLCWSPRRFWRRCPTFYREYHNIKRCQRRGIPTIVPLYYGEQVVAGEHRAILVTESLVGYRALSQWLQDWAKTGWPPLVQRQRIARALAAVVRQLHDSHLQHTALYADHIFLKVSGDKVNVALIDLEKLRFAMRPAFRDIDSLNRHTWHCPLKERLRFFKYYQGAGAPHYKKWCRDLAERFTRHCKRKGVSYEQAGLN